METNLDFIAPNFRSLAKFVEKMEWILYTT